MKNIAIVWFRNDLRIHDNEALEDAYATHDVVIPLFVIDPRVFENRTKYGFPKTGRYRARFIMESLADLRETFRKQGGELYVRTGHPEDVVFDMALEYKARNIFCNRERTSEEVAVQDSLEKNLWTIGQELRYNRGKMLYYTSDLPFPINQTPDVFSSFRKEVEKYVKVREPKLPTTHIEEKTCLDLEPGDIPNYTYFGHEPFERNSGFTGGESHALEQLQYYLWNSNLIASYKETRNGMLGWDFSSKLSPWLAAGCISPKYIYHELKRYERERTKNKSTYWLFFELMWRDFFRLMGKKHGDSIFKQLGTKNEPVDGKNWTDDKTKFAIWSEGRTGVPIVDANMKELNTTGFMSNRGRQIVASFLVNDLQVNWLLGAEYFESLLIDYDPCSNYGNWNYIAGVGSDPREDRYFNPISQSRKYDPQSAYIKHWIPELANVPYNYAYRPWKLSDDILEEANVVLGKHYPKPVVENGDW